MRYEPGTFGKAVIGVGARFIFGKNAVMDIQQSDGTYTTLDLLELAALDSIGATDLAKIDGITNGTQAAGKAVVTDANVNSGVSKITELHIGTSGSETEVTATAAELNLLDGQIATAVPVLTAGGATDEMDITITVADAAGATIADSHHLEVWITDDADALTLTGTSASGALTAVDGGILSVLTAKKHITCVTPATGIINLSLVDSANTAGEYVVVKLPSGLFSISAASVAGSYEGG
tara:strand:- start:13603 stop:14313 length:711 start_codon:yes stop_codon:yes gene_type:complete